MNYNPRKIVNREREKERERERQIQTPLIGTSENVSGSLKVKLYRQAKRVGTDIIIKYAQARKYNHQVLTESQLRIILDDINRDYLTYQIAQKPKTITRQMKTKSSTISKLPIRSNIMGLFFKLFGKKLLSPDEMNKLPPIYGGDATSAKKAAIINCFSMDLAEIIMDEFISNQHGKKDSHWSHESIALLMKPEYTRATQITTRQGKSYVYYFNISRPLKASVNLMKMLGLKNGK
jgi:hypothetical protein